jgi:hypothetical protein
MASSHSQPCADDCFTRASNGTSSLKRELESRDRLAPQELEQQTLEYFNHAMRLAKNHCDVVQVLLDEAALIVTPPLPPGLRRRRHRPSLPSCFPNLIATIFLPLVAEGVGER